VGHADLWSIPAKPARRAGAEPGEPVTFNRLFRVASELTPEQTKTLDAIVGAVGRGWLRQLPKLAATTCGNDVLAVAGLTAEQIATVRQPVIALYDEFSPFRATCSWLERHLPQCSAEIIPAAEHLAVVADTAPVTEAGRGAPR